MKLLFDENLSPKLANRLSDLFPNSLHVRDVGMKATVDPIVWDYAKDNNLMIVSKDSDMHDLSLVFGNPPKVIWLRLGNCSTLQVETLLRREFNTMMTVYLYLFCHSVIALLNLTNETQYYYCLHQDFQDSRIYRMNLTQLPMRSIIINSKI